MSSNSGASTSRNTRSISARCSSSPGTITATLALTVLPQRLRAPTAPPPAVPRAHLQPPSGNAPRPAPRGSNSRYRPTRTSNRLHQHRLRGSHRIESHKHQLHRSKRSPPSFNGPPAVVLLAAPPTTNPSAPHLLSNSRRPPLKRPGIHASPPRPAAVPAPL